MKLFKKAIRYILASAIIVFIFNIPVTTRQGMGGVVYEIKIPFYAKLCGFLYRDYQYKALSRRIVNGVEGNEKKVMAIYNWTIANVKRRPEGFTIVDDHIWDIIVRGYGTDDQAADVFTTLVSYAGYEAFWDKLYTENSSKALIISFVKINDKWHIFDVYNKKYLIDEGMQKMPTRYGPTYEEYLNSMDKTHFEIGIKRPDKQKLIPRLLFEFKKAFVR